MATLALVAAVLAVVAFASIIFGAGRFLQRRAAPNLARSKVVPDCGVPPAPYPPALTVTSSVQGGTHFDRRVSLAAGSGLVLTHSLTLIADQALTIDGTIDVPLASPTIDITLVSLNGDVVVGASGRVGGMTAFSGGPLPTVALSGANDSSTGPYALAIGEPGENGGFVKILAPKGNIKIDGAVLAQAGGNGGSGFANGTAVLGGAFGGSATAAGGQAGAGGDVILCAADSIGVTATGVVQAGGALRSGNGNATAANGQPASADGAPGNDGGTVAFVGTVPTTQIYFYGGRVEGGFTTSAGSGDASGGNGGREPGGLADARGGNGGRGGTVTFSSCFVIVAGRPLCQYGGDGGPATATGGVGGAGRVLTGYVGGDALAHGGDGGVQGPIPMQPRPDQTKTPGALDVSRGAGGGGGTATATGGNGGTGALLRGGSSGSADATGGTSGNSGIAATPTSKPSVGPIGAAGGVGPTAISPGPP